MTKSKVSNWQPSEDTCPTCGKETERYVTHDIGQAERCTNCKWQINFNPTTHKVPYGTAVVEEWEES